MAWDKDMSNIVEIFRVQTKGFDLWAAMISVENEKYTIRGRTRFKKGESCAFRSEMSDRSSLRDRMLSACGPIAAFYGTRVVHRKIKRRSREGYTYPLLAPASELIH